MQSARNTFSAHYGETNFRCQGCEMLGGIDFEAKLSILASEAQRYELS